MIDDEYLEKQIAETDAALVDETEVAEYLENRDPGVKMIDDDIIDSVIELAITENEADVEVEVEIADEETAIAEANGEQDPAEAKIKAIDAFTSKKKLDVYAEERGVKLDGRKTLKKMKHNLKEAWKLN
jgi:hypothetical protein